MNNLFEKFREAEKMMNENRLDEALKLFLELEKHGEFAPFCWYFIARISNMIGEPETAYNLYYQALETMPGIAGNLLPKEHTSHGYKFGGMKKEKENTKCPLCGEEGHSRWCYPLMEAGGYNAFFNPIRMWMYCKPCNHMFARHFPEKLFIYNDGARNANPDFFSYYSNILSNIRRYAAGMTLFEVGVGACECLLAAREIGYDAFGIDVIKRHVEDAKNKYGLNAEVADFNEFVSDKKWDVIIMGDVLEHVSDPVQAVAKAESLLKDDGALWISTPNFESAFSAAVGHNDAMRRQQYHLNYFSRDSLYMLLSQNGLTPVDYQISGHYNGSMEVIAVKKG